MLDNLPATVAPKGPRIRFDKDLVDYLMQNPHILGNLLGKTLLTEQHSRWCRWVWDQPGGIHTGLMAHRGSYKTTGITEIGCVRWWLDHPNDRIALIRKTFTAASESLAVVRQLMESEFVRALYFTRHGQWPEFTEKKADRLTFSFKQTMTKEASIGAYGINNIPTGLHVDRAICDDIVTDQDRYSDAEREKTIRSTRELLSNIIDRGKSVMFVGTPWHERDAWAEVIRKACPNRVVKFPRDSTGIITDTEFAKIVSLNTPAQIACNYHLTHIAADDLLFQRIAGERFWVNGGAHHVTAHVDAKFDGDATTALTFMQELNEKAPNGNNWIQISGWSSEKNVELIMDDIVDRCIKKKIRHFYMENNPDKGMVYRAIMGKFKARGYTVNTSKKSEVYNYAERMNKAYKIQTHLLHHWQNLLWDIDCCRTYKGMILDYQEGSRLVDAPDSAASLLREFYDTTKAQGQDWRWT